MNIVDKSREKLLLYENRHQTILDNSIRIFNSRGYKAATTAMIARESKISEPTLYKHFKNKKELFLACFQSIIGQLAGKNREILQQYETDEIACLEAICKAYFDFVDRNPDKSMFLVHMLSYKDDTDFNTAFETAMKKQIASVETVLHSAIQSGKIDKHLNPQFFSSFFCYQYFCVVGMKEALEDRNFKYEHYFDIIKKILKPNT